MSAARHFIGISGYDYPRWRGDFYPTEIPRRSWLAFASRVFSSIELNGTPRCQDGAVPLATADELPIRRRAIRRVHSHAAADVDGGRGGRARSRPPAAARLARRISGAHVAYRHAFEVRHPSYFHHEFYQLLREHRCGFVIADTAGKFGYAEEVTADFVYVRLHGSQALYASDYTDDELSMWAEEMRKWLAGGLDVYVYFDNDALVHAPYNAIWLETLVSESIEADY